VLGAAGGGDTLGDGAGGDTLGDGATGVWMASWGGKPGGARGVSGMVWGAVCWAKMLASCWRELRWVSVKGSSGELAVRGI
jgi:hypothetical protein